MAGAGDAEQVQDPLQQRAGIDESAGREVETDGAAPALLPGPTARPWARWLTQDGLARFDTWIREETTRLERRLYHELERAAFRRELPGDPVFNWERVEEAIRELETEQRRAIEDEIRQKVRADLLEELRGPESTHGEGGLRQGDDILRRRELAKRTRRRWRWFGSATLTTSSATSATMLGADSPAWLKLGVIALALGGAWLAGPGRGEH